MTTIDEEREFIARHREEISPLGVDMDDIEAALEAYRVKLYLMEKPAGTYESDALRIALSASDPLTLGTTRALILAMMGDRRFWSIFLVTDNVAAVAYRRLFSEDPAYAGFEEVEVGVGPAVVMEAIANEARMRPVDVALDFLESRNSPSGSLAFEWKSAYGVRRVFLINEGWNGLGHLVESFSRLKGDEIDGIFVNDESARKIMLDQLPSLEPKIRVTGTPVLDNLGLDRAEVYRAAGRLKLGLKEDDLAILFLGDVVSDVTTNGLTCDPRVNVITLETLVASVVEVALTDPSRHYAILVRPHARDDAEDVRALLSVRLPDGAPENVMLCDASDGVVAMHVATFSADVIASINSTGNHLAPPRGREAIFLGLEGGSLGAEVLRAVYGAGYRATLSAEPMKHVAGSGKELVNVIGHLSRAKNVSLDMSRASATTGILDEIARR